MLSQETRTEIAVMVRSGFYGHGQLVEIFTEEMYAPGELDPKEVVVAIDAQFAEYELEKLQYPDVTDCDRLDTAFSLMSEQGIIAIQNAGYTQSDGYDDVRDFYARCRDQDSILGYCFYHGQDLERAVLGQGLYFAFGPIQPADEQTVGVEVGNIVRSSLEQAGLSVNWDGTFEKRLSVPKLVWQKR